MFASLIMSQNDHGYEAGRYVAAHALAAFQQRPPSLLIACISQHYQKPEEVVRGIRSLAGAVPLIGACTNNVLTMTGPLGKGVAVLAVCADTTTTCSVEIGFGFSQQPTATLQRTQQQLQQCMHQPSVTATNQASSSPATSTASSAENSPQQNDYTTMLICTSGAIDSTQLTSVVQALNEHIPPRCTVYGAAVNTGTSASNGAVFANDEFAHDGVVIGLIPTSAPTGIGIAPTSDVAHNAARQAVDMVGKQSPAAAFVVHTIASQEEQAGKTEIDHVRTVIGYTTPLLGLAADSGFAFDKAHTQSLLVCTMS